VITGHYKAPKIISAPTLKPGAPQGQPNKYDEMEVGSVLHLHLWKGMKPNYVKPLEISATEQDWKVRDQHQGSNEG
jgi:hypothetical protein